MAFDITISAKKTLLKKTPRLNVEDILKNCNLNFGSYDDYYVLEEEKIYDNTMILYNPQKFARGIFMNLNKSASGKVTLSINLPTTPSEIDDLFNVINEIINQYVNVSLYIEDNKYDKNILGDLKEDLNKSCLDNLRQIASNNPQLKLIQTLVKFPYTFSDEDREKFKNAKDLTEYEELLHKIQDVDIYYAKPILRQKPGGDVLSCYSVSNNCTSVFPVDGKNVLCRYNQDSKHTIITFFILEEMKIVGGMYGYNDFINYMLDKGVEYFDDTHIKVDLSVQDIYDVTNVLKPLNI